MLVCANSFSVNAVFSPRITQGIIRGRGLGVACTFGLFPFPHQKKSVLKAYRVDMPKYAGENTGMNMQSVYDCDKTN